jgi:HEPN domain
LAVTRTEFQQLADVRIDEARVLLAQGKYDGAYYLAGYAVECALKACIAKLTNKDDFPDKVFVQRSYTHSTLRNWFSSPVFGTNATRTKR